MPSYISLFSVNAVGSLKLLAKLLGNLRLSKLAPQKRAIVMVLILLAVTSILGGIVATTPHAYTPMVLLGVFYGVVFSYPDRKSTRLNSSHLVISYAVFCLK